MFLELGKNLEKLDSSVFLRIYSSELFWFEINKIRMGAAEVSQFSVQFSVISS